MNLYVTKYNTVWILSILIMSNKNYKVFSFSWKVKKSKIWLFDSATKIWNNMLMLYVCRCFHLHIYYQLAHHIFLSTDSFYLCLTKIKYLIKYPKLDTVVKSLNYNIFLIQILMEFASQCLFSLKLNIFRHTCTLHFVGLSLELNS